MKKWIIRIILVLLTFVFFVYVFHPGIKKSTEKKVLYAHLSFDDVISCFEDLSKDSSLYNSIFDHPFFSKLMSYHEKYECKFTLYAYKYKDNYDISQMPLKFKNDFIENSDWLKIGFHSSTVQKHTPEYSDFTKFKHDFESFNLSLNTFASSKSIASILRLDYFYASPLEVFYLKDKGVTVLLSSDDDRRSYLLPLFRNEQLLRNNSISYEGIKYLRTNIRLENISYPFLEILKNRNKDTLVIFTHEWRMNRINYYKLERTIRILSDCKYKFICE